MKHLLIIILALLMSVGCTPEPHDLVVCTKDVDNVRVMALMKDGRKVHLITTYEHNRYDIKADVVEKVYVEYEGEEDLNYKVSVIDGFYYCITENPPFNYTIKCLIPDEAFVGSDKIIIEYLGRTKIEYAEVKKERPTYIASHNDPKLKFSTCNGYPVSLRVDGNQIIIY